MNESPYAAIEALKIITEFLSNNSTAIVLLVLVIICRGAISSFISRLHSLTYTAGKSQIDMKAVAPSEDKETTDVRTADEKPSAGDKGAEIVRKQDQWFPDMHRALEEGRLDDAEEEFKKYALDEKDEVKLEKQKAFYLFLRFEQGKDNSAIGQLEQLARATKTEDSKFETLTWLSFCLRHGMQYRKETEMWRSVLEEIQSESLKTRAIVNIGYSLNKEESSIEAKNILTDRLMITKEDAQKALIFEALSSVEESLGNKSLSIYCKDKSLEFDPNNRDELFNSAYSASDQDIDEISISNYLKLIRIDGDNPAALNNLGARAQEAGLKIKAIDQYKKSAEHNNTLAMANQGYLLLDAGFTDEAEKIAKEALEKDTPHQNIHSLLAEINERREKQDKDWEELGKKALNRQKMIREYTEQLYLGKAKTLKGDWEVNGTHSATIKIDNDLLKATWTEEAGGLGGEPYKVELVGKVSGSTFEGTYSRQRNESSPNTLLGLSRNTNKACMGYFSEREREIKVFSKTLKDDFSLCLSPKKA
jgi:hypothetical protein